MINVLFYALPNRNSGGYSVVLNLYEDIKEHIDLYPDIHWFFITGLDGFNDTDNITVFNEEWALKSYLHRFYYTTVKLKQFVKKYDIKVIISLNMGVSGLNIPSIISLHNVLPLYKCNSNVFDKRRDMLKQMVINHFIKKSIKRANSIIVPSVWIKETLTKKFKVLDKNIYISPISTPEIDEYIPNGEENRENSTSEGIITRFIYPASGFPYKNHRVIVEAAKKLINDGITTFYIRFSGNVGNGKTIKSIKREINKYKLPIEFAGLLPVADLIKAYKYETLLFPSKIETDGFPLLESMACGGCIVASDLPYAREALSNYTNYKLFDPDNSTELADILKELIGSKGKEIKKENIKTIKGIPRTSVLVPLIRTLSK